MDLSLTRSLLCILFASMCSAYGATNYVTPGDSIQAVVNASSPGDTIVIFGGTYTESVTVNKWLSIVRQAGQTVYVTGNFTFEGISAAPATPLVISNLKIGGDSGKRLYINSCINVTVNNLDLSLSGLSATGSSNLVVGNITSGPFAISSCPYVLASAITVGHFSVGSCSNVVVANSTLGNADMSSSTVNFSRVTLPGFVRMNNTGFTNRALNLLQCNVTNDFVEVTYGLARILYSELRYLNLNYADSVVVGNRIRSLQNLGLGTVRLDNGKAIVRNNEIGPIAPGGDFSGGANNNGLWVNNCAALIANNYIHDLGAQAPGSPYQEGEDDREGVYIPSTTKRIEIVGNIFWGARRGVYGPFDNVIFRYNNLVSAGGPAGGVIPEANIAQDPLFVNKAGGDYHLAGGSPCLNAGPPDAWFNDRDSTRNDMGIFGGSAYDPDGKTTDKPITFLLQASPFTVIKGVHPNVNISGGGIVIAK